MVPGATGLPCAKCFEKLSITCRIVVDMTGAMLVFVCVSADLGHSPDFSSPSNQILDEKKAQVKSHGPLNILASPTRFELVSPP